MSQVQCVQVLYVDVYSTLPSLFFSTSTHFFIPSSAMIHRALPTMRFNKYLICTSISWFCLDATFQPYSAWSCSWPFDLWSSDLSCPALFFCRILYSMPHLSISWKKKVRSVIPSAGVLASMLDSKWHTDLSIFGNLSKLGSLISTPQNLFAFGLFTAQIQRSSCEWQKGAKEARFSENVSQISHLFIPSSKNSILNSRHCNTVYEMRNGKMARKIWTLPLGAFIVKITVHIRI